MEQTGAGFEPRVKPLATLHSEPCDSGEQTLPVNWELIACLPLTSAALRTERVDAYEARENSVWHIVNIHRIYLLLLFIHQRQHRSLKFEELSPGHSENQWQSSDKTRGFFIISESHSIDGPCLPLVLQQGQPGVLQRHLNLKADPGQTGAPEDQLFTTLISETRTPTLRVRCLAQRPQPVTVMGTRPQSCTPCSRPAYHRPQSPPTGPWSAPRRTTTDLCSQCQQGARPVPVFRGRSPQLEFGRGPGTMNSEQLNMCVHWGVLFIFRGSPENSAV